MLDLAFRMLLDLPDAEDVVQEAFSRLARADIPQIDDPEGWLVVVTSRLCLDRLRTRRRRPTNTLDAADEPPDWNALDRGVELEPFPGELVEHVVGSLVVRTSVWHSHAGVGLVPSRTGSLGITVTAGTYVRAHGILGSEDGVADRRAAGLDGGGRVLRGARPGGRVPPGSA
jgi:hypothetical protein